MTEERGGKGRGEAGEEVKRRLGELVEVRERVRKNLGERMNGGGIEPLLLYSK